MRKNRDSPLGEGGSKRGTPVTNLSKVIKVTNKYNQKQEIKV